MAFKQNTVDVRYVNEQIPGKGVGAYYAVTWVGIDTYSTADGARAAARRIADEKGATVNDMIPSGSGVRSFGFGADYPAK